MQIDSILYRQRTSSWTSGCIELGRHVQRSRLGAMLRALQVSRKICRSA